jgi:hypothetical protein
MRLERQRWRRGVETVERERGRGRGREWETVEGGGSRGGREMGWCK